MRLISILIIVFLSSFASGKFDRLASLLSSLVIPKRNESTSVLPIYPVTSMERSNEIDDTVSVTTLVYQNDEILIDESYARNLSDAATQVISVTQLLEMIDVTPSTTAEVIGI